VVPLSLAEANAFVSEHHRHHPPAVGHKFSIGVIDEEGELHGCAIVGRPVARARDDGLTLEVTRSCTDGTPNANSMLYGAAARAGFAMGYTRIGTYTLGRETGASLRGAGWHLISERTINRTWATPTDAKRKSAVTLGETLRLWEVSA
jgi:hypothetical protein